MDLILIEGEYKNLKISHNNKTLTIHSSNPYKEAERISSHFNPELDYVILAGVGLGYLVEYLIKNTSYKLIIFEHFNELLELLKKEKKELFSDERIRFFSNLDDVFNFLDNNYIREFNFYIHRPYITVFPEIYGRIESEFLVYLSKRKINQNTLKRFQKVWLKNIIKNSKYYFNLPGIKDIKHNFYDKPAVIVGAGPSLSKNIQKLKKLKDSAVIISTDTALCLLVGEDIIPDFVVSVDPQDKNALYLIGIKDKSKLPFLVADSSVAFITMVHYPQNKIIIYDTIFPLYGEIKKFFGEKGQLKSGGSVSTTAFDLARYFGCNPIVFIGQDLAYTGFKTHSENNILENMFFNTSNRLNNFESYNARSQVFADRIMIRGNKESFVLTDRKFMTFLEWFKREIKETKQLVINASEGGAFIEGATHISLEDAIKDISIDKRFEVLHDRKIREEEFISHLKEIVSVIDSLLPFAYKAVNAAKSMLSEFKILKNPQKYYEDMNNFDFNFLRAIKTENLGRFIELTMQDSILKLLERKEEKTLTEDIVSNWLQFYIEAKNGLLFTKHLIIKRLKL
ncbi:MAG: DUF115 domain-containing protein [Brevinematales bacterium]|nr:DUF115 domain-containing protein [Brevinematales bacterium]